jgi:phenylalanyl-tRNA synthetase alpha chain
VGVLHKYEIAILRALKKGDRLSLREVMDGTKLGKDEVLWALQNLSAKGFVDVRKELSEEASLSPEGNEYAERGLPERALARRLVSGPVPIADLKGEQIGFMWAKKKGLVTIDKGLVRLTEKGRRAEGGSEEERILKELQSDRECYRKYRDTDAVSEFRKRGLLEIRSREEVSGIGITEKGVRAVAGGAPDGSDSIERVERSVIRNRLWVGKKFREYNVGAPVEPEDAAMKHPLRRTIDEIKDAYLSMGFREVSGPVIEPSFWVFDHLFMPQDHPARDVQDTFFLSEPGTLPVEDKELVGRIRKAHEEAWHIGWSEEIASQAVARTHTTSVTGRYMYAILKELKENPKKYELPIKIFTVGRNLRNENIDYKHLADFYQTDGIIIGRNLTLANLFDTLIKLYGRIGIKVRFVPMYYPFVEPGVNVRIEVNGEWMEVGGAGIIRREVTGVDRRTMTVLAWGLSLERLLFVKDRNLDSIASLYNSSVGWLRERSIR